MLKAKTIHIRRMNVDDAPRRTPHFHFEIQTELGRSLSSLALLTTTIHIHLRPATHGRTHTRKLSLTPGWTFFFCNGLHFFFLQFLPLFLQIKVELLQPSLEARFGLTLGGTYELRSGVLCCTCVCVCAKTSERRILMPISCSWRLARKTLQYALVC